MIKKYWRKFVEWLCIKTFGGDHFSLPSFNQIQFDTTSYYDIVKIERKAMLPRIYMTDERWLKTFYEQTMRELLLSDGIRNLVEVEKRNGFDGKHITLTLYAGKRRCRSGSI